MSISVFCLDAGSSPAGDCDLGGQSPTIQSLPCAVEAGPATPERLRPSSARSENRQRTCSTALTRGRSQRHGAVPEGGLPRCSPVHHWRWSHSLREEASAVPSIHCYGLSRTVDAIIAAPAVRNDMFCLLLNLLRECFGIDNNTAVGLSKVSTQLCGMV